MIELNGLNHTNLKTMLTAVENNFTTLQDFFSIGNIFPVVKIKKLRIDDDVEEDHDSTINHEQYFREALKVDARTPEKIKDPRDLSCTALHLDVEKELMKLFTKTSQFIHSEHYTPVYTPEEFQEGDITIDIEDGMSVAIIDYSVVLSDDESSARKKRKKKATKALEDRLKLPKFKFLKLQTQGNSEEKQKIAITGFLVVNVEKDYYEVNDIVDEDSINSEGRGRKYKNTVKKIQIDENYEGDKDDTERTRKFQKENTYYTLQNIQIEEAIEKIIQSERISTSLESLNPTPIVVKNKSGEKVCSNEAIFDFGKGVIKSMRQKTTGLVQDIEAAEKVRRVSDSKPNNVNVGAPTLPDAFFHTKKRIEIEPLRKMFRTWEEGVIDNVESQNFQSKEEGIVSNQETSKNMKAYFNQVHQVKYMSELKGERITNHSITYNEEHFAYDSQQILQNVQNRDQGDSAITQFKSFKDNGSFEVLPDELVTLIEVLIESVGFRSLQENYAISIFEWFVLKFYGTYTTKKRQAPVYICILMVAGLYIVHSQIENKRFILAPGFDQYYEHESWPLWNKNTEFNDRSCILYAVQVIHEKFRAEIPSDKTVEDGYKMMKYLIDKQIIPEFFKKEWKKLQNERNVSNAIELVSGHENDDNQENDLTLCEKEIRKIPKESIGKLWSTERKSISEVDSKGPEKYTRNEYTRNKKEKFREVLKKVLNENGFEYSGSTEFDTEFREHVFEIQKSYNDDLSKSINKIKQSTEVSIQAKFVQANVHKDLFLQHSDIFKDNDTFNFANKFSFRSETLLGSSISMKEKVAVKLFCIMMHLLKLSNEKNDNFDQLRKAYLKYTISVFEKLVN
jgi:hypothetical protein